MFANLSWLLAAHLKTSGPLSSPVPVAGVAPVVQAAAPAAATPGFVFPNPADFSWTDFDMHASVVIGVGLVSLLYWYGVGPARKKYNLSTEPVETWRVVSFVAAMAVMMGMSNGPIHHLSDYFLFSAHMVQHLFYMQVFPPLLLLAIPAWLWRPLVAPRGVLATGRVLARPLVAFVISSFVMVCWHVPYFYELAMRNHDLHIVQHLSFIVASVIMWFPVINPIPDVIEKPGPLVQMIYLFLTTLPMCLIGIIEAMAGSVLYPFYAEAPRVFAGVSALQDQVLGGLIMWVPGAMLPWFAIARVFYNWYKSGEDGVRPVAGGVTAPVPRT